MKKIIIDVSRIKSWDDFHDVFSKELNFPDYYGRNMDAWIDCMTDFGYNNTKVVLSLEKVEVLKKNNRDIYDAINELSAFVNYRFIENGEDPYLFLSYYIENQ